MDHSPRSSSVRWFQLAGVWALYASFGLSASSLAPLVPLIEVDLGITHAQMGLVMGAWQLTYIAAAVPCGVLLDRLEARWALSIGAGFVALSMLARSFATDLWQMLAAVMLFGVGGPIVSSGAPKVITRWFTGTGRGLAMGIYMTGPAIGGIITLTMTHSVFLPWLDGSWREVLRMWSMVTACAAALWFAIASMPGARVDQREARADNLADEPERQTSIMRQILADPAVRLLLLMSIGVFFFNHGLNNWLPELLRSKGMSMTMASVWAALPTVVGIVGSLIIPRLATVGRRFHILALLSLSAALASVLLQWSLTSTLAVGLFLQGVARSSLMTVLVLTLVELPKIGEQRAGTASGMFFSAAEVGGVLGPVTLGLLYDYSGGFALALGLLTLIACVLGAGAIRLGQLARG